MKARPVLCAVRRCTTPVERGKLMCKGHWFSVPKPLRSAVWRTWRVVQNWRGRADRETRVRQIADYREAVRAACESVASVRPTPAAAMTTVAIENGQPVQFVQGRLL